MEQWQYISKQIKRNFIKEIILDSAIAASIGRILVKKDQQAYENDCKFGMGYFDAYLGFVEYINDKFDCYFSVNLDESASYVEVVEELNIICNDLWAKKEQLRKQASAKKQDTIKINISNLASLDMPDETNKRKKTPFKAKYGELESNSPQPSEAQILVVFNDNPELIFYVRSLLEANTNREFIELIHTTTPSYSTLFKIANKYFREAVHIKNLTFTNDKFYIKTKFNHVQVLLSEKVHNYAMQLVPNCPLKIEELLKQYPKYKNTFQQLIQLEISIYEQKKEQLISEMEALGVKKYHLTNRLSWLHV